MPGTLAQIVEHGVVVVVEVIDRTETGVTIVRGDGSQRRMSLEALRRATNEAWTTTADPAR